MAELDWLSYCQLEGAIHFGNMVSDIQSKKPTSSSFRYFFAASASMPMDKISTKDFIGTTVYGADDAKVGEIGDVVLTGDKKVDAVVVDVGGFLGMSEKAVAVGLEKLKFLSDKDGNRYLYTNFTKAQLEAQT